jgi:hypothetical protein
MRDFREGNTHKV